MPKRKLWKKIFKGGISSIGLLTTRERGKAAKSGAFLMDKMKNNHFPSCHTSS